MNDSYTEGKNECVYLEGHHFRANTRRDAPAQLSSRNETSTLPKTRATRAIRPFELIHSDSCSILGNPYLSGALHYLLFIESAGDPVLGLPRRTHPKLRPALLLRRRQAGVLAAAARTRQHPSLLRSPLLPLEGSPLLPLEGSLLLPLEGSPLLLLVCTYDYDFATLIDVGFSGPGGFQLMVRCNQPPAVQKLIAK